MKGTELVVQKQRRQLVPEAEIHSHRRKQTTFVAGILTPSTYHKHTTRTSFTLASVLQNDSAVTCLLHTPRRVVYMLKASVVTDKTVAFGSSNRSQPVTAAILCDVGLIITPHQYSWHTASIHCSLWWTLKSDLSLLICAVSSSEGACTCLNVCTTTSNLLIFKPCVDGRSFLTTVCFSSRCLKPEAVVPDKQHAGISQAKVDALSLRFSLRSLSRSRWVVLRSTTT